LIDEVEAFEARLHAILPSTWTLERELLAPTRRRGPTFLGSSSALDPLISTPWSRPEDRAWVLSTPWPGAPWPGQRLSLFLFLSEPPATIDPGFDRLAKWERFEVVAQPPSTTSIGGQSFDWDTLPDWPGARASITAALR